MNSQCPSPRSQAVTFTFQSASLLGEVLSTTDDEILIQDLLPASSLPSILQTDRPAHTSANEVFRLTSTRTIRKKDVTKSHSLVDLLTFRPSKPNLLVRQTYDQDTNRFLPEEPPFKCVCGKVINPDENYSLCLHCPAGFHNECLQGSPKCPTCEDLVKIRKDDVLVINFTPSKSPSGSGANHTEASAQLSSVQVIRSSVVSFLESSLSLAASESSQQISATQIHALAIQCESELFALSDDMENSTLYTRQARALKFNLSAKDNMELRGGLLSGEIQPRKLVGMNSQEMASSRKKQMRIERDRNEFIQKRRKLVSEHPTEGSGSSSDDPFDPNNH